MKLKGTYNLKVLFCATELFRYQSCIEISSVMKLWTFEQIERYISSLDVSLSVLIVYILRYS